jgi:hypothetical protein
MSATGWNEPKRIRRSVQANGRHLGYVTLVAYPNRELTAFTEGSPYHEVVISDQREGHVALLQRFKEHWLVQCGTSYRTTKNMIEMTERVALALAIFALRRNDVGEPLAEAMADAIEALNAVG